LIARKTWREVRVTVAVYLVLLELLLVPVILLWPDFYPDLQRSTLFRNAPIDFLKRIVEGVTASDEAVAYRNWIAVMAFFRSTNLVGLAAAVLLGTSLVAREREAQTFELLLSRPVSRGQILFQKCWPTALCVTLPIFAVSASAIFWSRTIGHDLPWWEMFLASLHAAVFVLCLLALTTWVSTLCRVQAHVAAWVGGLTVLQLGVYMTQRLRQFSVFRLADFEWYGPILAGNTPAWQMFDPIRSHGFTTWLLAATATFYGLAYRALRRAEP
jgi:ABC-type transport system involved in multi-copper enzyme maturation permease subunit